MTVSGARQHLTSLTEHGLVAPPKSCAGPSRRGRPQFSYPVTALADALFPKAYGALTNELLGYLDDEDAHARRPALRPPPRHAGSPTPSADWRQALAEAKVTELAQILDEDGYLATAEPIGPDRYPHRRAQLRHRRRRPTLRPGVHERDRLHPGRPAWGRRRRTQHMVAGDRHCAYEIRATQS